jgi:hypothetical protein
MRKYTYALILILAVCLLLSVKAFAAGSATTTWESIGSDIDVATITWIASASDGTFSNYTIPRGVGKWLKGGCLYEAKTIPGTVAPTDLYDITVLNGTIDMAGGQLANRSTSAEQDVRITTILCIEGQGTTPPVITISNNSVHSATGVIKLWFGR